MKYYIDSHGSTKELIREHTSKDGKVMMEHYVSDRSVWVSDTIRRVYNRKEININQVNFYKAISEWPYYTYKDADTHWGNTNTASSSKYQGNAWTGYVRNPRKITTGL